MDKLTPEQEAEKMYPDADAQKIKKEFPEERDHVRIIDTINYEAGIRRSAHITAARMYIGGIKNLEDENLKMRDALYCIIGRIEGVEWEGLDMVNAVQKVKEYATEALKTNTQV